MIENADFSNPRTIRSRTVARGAGQIGESALPTRAIAMRYC